MKLSIEYKQPRVEVGFTAPSLGVSTGTPVARDYVERPAYDGPYSATPSESAQTLSTNGKRMTGDVAVGAIPSDYVGSEVPRNTSADMTADGPTIYAPAGYYAALASKSVPSGSASTPDTEVTVNPEISLSPTGLITASVSGSQSITPSVTEGYVERGTAGVITFSGSYLVQLPTQEAKTIIPTESQQVAVPASKFTTGEVKVEAIPDSYIGSAVPQRSSSDLTVSGATVIVPGGHYAVEAEKSIQQGSVVIPSDRISLSYFSASINDSTGAITVSASGDRTYTPAVTAGYVDSVDSKKISAFGSGIAKQIAILAGTTITPTESEQTAAPTHVWTTGDIKVGAIPSNYVGSAVPTQSAQTITPTTADQTIASGKFLTGAQTIKGDANLLPENIKRGVTIFGIVGTYDGN